MKTVLTLTLFLTSTISSSAITIDTVRVGDVGNPTDPATGDQYGFVSYVYNIGKYEVTVGQYAAFLNAVGATDTYGLYNSEMTTDLNVAGIERTGNPGSYTYGVIGSPNRPIAHASWADAARFANWVHNGQPTGAQDAGTTEDGAYAINGATTNAALMAVTRKPDARWFIPTEDEWYKAAYYQPVTLGGDSDSYWAYPLKTNSIPYSDQPPGAAPDNTRVGNFYFNNNLTDGYDDGYAVTGSTSYSATQNYLTDVGAYTSSPSYYGTFDQGGNVGEWNESTSTANTRRWRGGKWSAFPIDALASFAPGNTPTYEGAHQIGFRVASLPTPEPATMLLIGFGVVLCGGLRCRR